MTSAVRIGRYLLFEPIAAGGMAAVHFGRMLGPLGFTKTVAIKRLHGHLLSPDLTLASLVDEARLTARLSHPSIVQTLDVVSEPDEVLLVMEYVHGESLAKCLRMAHAIGATVPLPIATATVVQILRGLHAAHEARDDSGVPLGIVHRDVSPQNVLVGVDGEVKILDFGIAKVLARPTVTRTGIVKGKLGYLAPEMLRGGGFDRRADLFAATVVFWEMLVGDRLFGSDDPTTVMDQISRGEVAAPGSLRPDGPLDPRLDALVLRGLATDPKERFSTAAEMATAIEEVSPLASASQVASWFTELCSQSLERRSARLVAIERTDPDKAAKNELPMPAAGEDAPSPAEVTAPGETSPAAGDAPIGPSREDARKPSASARRRWAVLGIVVVGLGALFVVGIAGGWLASGPPAGRPQGRTEAASVSVALAASTPTVSQPSDALPDPIAPASAASSAARRAFGGHRPRVPTPAVRPETSRSPDCTNPYVLDEQGRRRYRRECLHP